MEKSLVLLNSIYVFKSQNRNVIQSRGRAFLFSAYKDNHARVIVLIE